MEDGDAQYLRETGVAHLLHAASLQASAGDPKKARNAFATLVGPTGQLQLPLALLRDAVGNATKMHPDLFLRFLRGTVEDVSMADPHDPAPLDFRGARGAALAHTLQSAAEAAVARDADIVAGASPNDHSPVFATAVVDLARGIRALSALRLQGVPQPPVPAKGEASQLGADLDKGLQLHVDVMLALPFASVEPPALSLEVLSDAVAQLRWILSHFAIASGNEPSPEGASPNGYTFSAKAPPTFHIHASMPSATDDVSAEEHRMLSESVARTVAQSPIADFVTVLPVDAADALASVLSFAAPAGTTCRAVAAVGADPRTFHLGQVGESLAACVAAHAAAAVVNGEGELGPSVGAAPSPGAASIPVAAKAAPRKGGKGAAAAPSPASASHQSPSGASAASQAGAADKKGTVAYAGCLRPCQRPHAATATAVFADRVTSPWFAGHLKRVSGTAFASGTFSVEDDASAGLTSMSEHDAGGAHLSEVDVVALPCVCFPFAAFASLAPASSPQGSVPTSVRVETLLRACGLTSPTASEATAAPSHVLPRPATLSSPGWLFAFALGVSKALRCSVQPFLVTRGWCGEATAAHASGRRVAPTTSEVQSMLDHTLWLGTVAADAAAALPEKDSVLEVINSILTKPPSATQWRKEIASVV